MSLLDRLRATAAWNPRDYRRFVVGGRVLGQVSHRLADRLVGFAPVFRAEAQAVILADDLETPEARTRALGSVIQALQDEGALPPPSRLMAPLLRYWGETPALYLDGSALPAFGARGFGLAVTAFEEKPQDTVVYLATLGSDYADGPGRLDTTVHAPLHPRRTLRDNLLDAAARWAGISERTLVLSSKATSLVSSITARAEGGLSNHACFCFDLGPLRNVTPRPSGGPAESFQAMPVTSLIELLRETEDVARPAAPVLIDFLVRHGFVTPASQPDYQPLIQFLRLGHEAERDYWQWRPHGPPAPRP